MYKKTVLVSALLSLFIFNTASANFFKNITNLIEGNYESLRYGISVADVDNNGTYEFIVAGFGSENLALSYKNNKLRRIEKLYNKGEYLNDLNNQILKYIKDLFNKEFVIFKDKFNAKPKGGEGFLAHYDGIFYFEKKDGSIPVSYTHLTLPTTR